jgi:hypothetical protein
MAEFRPDGCTSFWDAWWRACCTLHDALTWWRPDGVTNAEAIQAMTDCMTSLGAAGFSGVAAAGLVVFGWIFWRRGRRAAPGTEPRILAWWLRSRRNPNWKEMPDDKDHYPPDRPTV